MKTKSRYIFILFFLSILVGPAWAGSSEGNVIIVVEQQDTLSAICSQYLSDPQKWPEIARLNGLANSDLIYPGQQLKIPARLLAGVPVDGTVTFAKGETMILQKEHPQWQPLHNQDTVPQGATIRTGPESALEVSFADGSALFLWADTTVGMILFRGSGGLFQGLYEFFLGSGRVISKVKSATGQKPRYKIRSPSAVAAVRGTEFRTTLDLEDATRLEVLQGKVAVSAAQKEIMVQEGEGTLVSKNHPPRLAKKLFPPPEPRGLLPLYRELPLRFDLEPVSGAVRYRIMLSSDREARNVVKSAVVAAHEPAMIPEVQDGDYFLKIQSIDELGFEGPASDPYPVKVRANPLPPFMQSPRDGEELRRSSVPFRWLTVGDAAGYHLQLADDKEFQILVQEHQDLRKTELDVSGLPPKTYYFRICSMAPDGYEGMWSDPLGFTIIPPPPSPPVEPPEEGDQEMHIRWRDLGPGISYHFQMAQDQEFSGLLTDKRLERPEVTIPKPEQPGTYYVRTSSIAPDGYEGGFSPAQNFTVAKQFPYGKIGLFLAVALGLVLLP